MTAYDEIIDAAARRYNLDPALITAIAIVESGMNPAAIGDGGKSIGLMQINTAAHPQHTRAALLNPTYNINAGAAILAAAMKTQPTLGNAIIAYNGSQGRPTATGQSYLRKVIAAYKPRQFAPVAWFFLLITGFFFALVNKKS